MSNLKPKHATLTFDADKYTVTVYNGINVKLPFREAVWPFDIKTLYPSISSHTITSP